MNILDSKASPLVVDIKELKRRVSETISGDDLIKILNTVGITVGDIITYDDIDKYPSIFDLLPEDGDCKIILIETRQNYGHWCVILRYNKTIEWFNSYGAKPQTELSYISNIKNILLGQGKDDFDDLIKDIPADWEVIYNKKRFQGTSNNINTCGRWCILRIMTLKGLRFDLPQFIKFIEENRKKTGLTPDLLVCAWVPKPSEI